MKRIYFCVALLFLLFNCKKTNEVLQENNLCDTIRLYSIEESEDRTIEETRSINNSIYEQRRKEIINFCTSFIDALKSKELENIEDKIEFPLSVECFVTKEKGKVIDKKDFILYFDSIFDDSFYKYFSPLIHWAGL
jgi:hypothetical protein